MGIRKEIQDFKSQIKESLPQHTVEVYANMDSIPDIAIIGCIGARDNFLFEKSENTVELFRKTTRKDPEITVLEGMEFIVCRGIGGGAAHYIIEQLPYYYDGTIGLWSLMGNCPEIHQIIDNLEKNHVQYFIIVIEDIPQTQYCGIMGLNNERCWVEEASYHGTMELLYPDFLPPPIIESPLPVITTQTMVKNAMEYVSRSTKKVGFQLFDKYVLDAAFTHPSFKKLLRQKVSILNINEHELDQLLHLYGISSQNDIFTVFPETVFFIGLGPLGGGLASSETHFLYEPSFFLEDIFPVGAGDTAFAGGLGCLLRVLSDSEEVVPSFSHLDKEEHSMILDSFCESGLVGVQIPYPSIPLDIRRKLIAESKEISEGTHTYFTEIGQLENFFEKNHGENLRKIDKKPFFSRIDGKVVREIFMDTDGLL
ncbi:MAG: hypothetical protein HXS54_03175 [Theionarchaea archaeon]|nr:hypothetical protein [Theionarchaea archaeon]